MQGHHKIETVYERDMMKSFLCSKFVIYPVFRNKFFAFLYRKTHLPCFVKRWESGDGQEVQK